MTNLQCEELLISAVILQCPPLPQLLKFVIALILLETSRTGWGIASTTSHHQHCFVDHHLPIKELSPFYTQDKKLSWRTDVVMSAVPNLTGSQSMSSASKKCWWWEEEGPCATKLKPQWSFHPSNWTLPSEHEAHAQLAWGRQMPWVRLRRHDHMNVSLQPKEQLCLPLWHFLPACILSKEMHCCTRQMPSFWFWLTASLEADSANILKWSEPMVKLYQPLCVTRVSIS